MGADELEVCPIDIIESVLVIGLIDPEDPKIGKEREKTQRGDGSCNGSGIMFLDSSLEEMIGKLFGKSCCLCGGSEIAIEDHHGKRTILLKVGFGQID